MSARMSLDARGPAELILSVAVSELGTGPDTETLTIVQKGQRLQAAEALDLHGTRLHRVWVEAGPVDVFYSCRVEGRSAPLPVDAIDEVRYLRPSRYCESDTLGPIARAEFQGVTGADLLAAVSSWVGARLAYVPGSSGPTDGSVQTLLARRGVCRDYAHLVIAFLRALDVPARLVSVYAPGLYPMDFHAVAEAAIDGQWRAVDATTLAPRQTLVRIATGRDASDTAFLSTRGAAVDMGDLEVTAIADTLPFDDVRDIVNLG